MTALLATVAVAAVFLLLANAILNDLEQLREAAAPSPREGTES